MCASPNGYVWQAPPGHCESDPGPESGIFQAADPPREASTFVPPAAAGEIFVVVAYKRGGRPTHTWDPWERTGPRLPTNVAIAWGSWRRHGVVSPAAPRSQGFVLKLRHVNPDSVPLLLATDGEIVVETQQRRPAEWTDATYQHLEW
jgi:hypothetical protein